MELRVHSLLCVVGRGGGLLFPLYILTLVLFLFSGKLYDTVYSFSPEKKMISML